MGDPSQLSCVPRAFSALATLTDEELAAGLHIDVAAVRAYRRAPHETPIEQRQALVAVLRRHGIRAVASELEFETNGAAWIRDRMKQALSEGLSRKAAEQRVWRELREHTAPGAVDSAILVSAGLTPGRES